MSTLTGFPLPGPEYYPMVCHFYRKSICGGKQVLIMFIGFVNETNPAGIAYYKNLIAALKENNIEPLVTMHHWDHPTAIEDLGGFLNPEIQEWFVDYARFLFETYGDDVKHWVTFNEPKQTCDQGYVVYAIFRLFQCNF